MIYYMYTSEIDSGFWTESDENKSGRVGKCVRFFFVERNLFFHCELDLYSFEDSLYSCIGLSFQEVFLLLLLLVFSFFFQIFSYTPNVPITFRIRKTKLFVVKINSYKIVEKNCRVCFLTIGTFRVIACYASICMRAHRRCTSLVQFFSDSMVWAILSFELEDMLNSTHYILLSQMWQNDMFTFLYLKNKALCIPFII